MSHSLYCVLVFYNRQNVSLYMFRAWVARVEDKLTKASKRQVEGGESLSPLTDKARRVCR